MIQRIGVELGGLLHRGQPRVHRLLGNLKPLIQRLADILRRLFQRLEPCIHNHLGRVHALVERLGVFRIHARLTDAAGQLFQAGGELAHLAGGIVRGGGDLIGQTRQALMQGLDRFLDAVMDGRPFQPLQPLMQAITFWPSWSKAWACSRALMFISWVVREMTRLDSL